VLIFLNIIMRKGAAISSLMNVSTPNFGTTKTQRNSSSFAPNLYRNYKVYRFPPIAQAFTPLTPRPPPLKPNWKPKEPYLGYTLKEKTFGRKEENSVLPLDIPNPRKIKKYLDQYIVGQEEMKISLSVAIFNHYQRVLINSEEEDGTGAEPVRIEKSNVLLMGPTGCGKTLTVKTIAQLLQVPFSHNDATSFTQTGYVGEDVEACISRLLQVCDYDVEVAERGIVFVDEIDKIAKKSDSNQRDVSGEGVQQGLLRMLEGTTIHVNVKPGTIVGKRFAQPGEVLRVDTSNILFICSGAFVGLEKLVESRMNQKRNIGFESEGSKLTPKSTSLDYVEADDIVRFGFIPELVGRLPVFSCAHHLTDSELAEILTKPRNAMLKQYIRLFKNSNIDLTFQPETINLIAEIVSKKETGARGLRRIMESILQKPLFEHSDSGIQKLVITPKYLEKYH
jgi:ATP-dependent Clp protease ATP-binding subunit ClpX